MPTTRKKGTRCRTLCLLLAIAHMALCLSPLPTAALPSEQEDTLAVSAPGRVSLNVEGLSAQSAVLMDADSGQVLYECNADTRLPMASTTKIMTALCAFELGELTDVIRVDARAVGIEGSSVYLSAGERLTLHQLLYALLLSSANDAAVAIAIGTAGSVEAFVAHMNQKAKALGLKNTHFENPHGLDDEEHYTTAYELALITRELLSHPLLATICATRKTTIPQGNAPNARLLVNHNKLLRNYAGCIGVKTGFTKRSGRCLVSAAEREGLTLIAVTLNAPDDWNDHTRLLDAGFDAYERVVLCERGGYETPIPVTGGKEAYVVVRSDHTVAVTLPRRRGAVRCTVESPRFLFATVDQNETVGRLIFWCDTDGDGDEEDLATVPLTTAYAVERKPTKGVLGRLISRLWHQ